MSIPKVHVTQNSQTDFCAVRGDTVLRTYKAGDRYNVQEMVLNAPSGARIVHTAKFEGCRRYICNRFGIRYE